MTPTYEIDPLRDPRYADLLSRSAAATVFHSAPWLTALQSTYGYRPIGLTTSEPGRPLSDALVFCEVRSLLTGNRLVSLPFSDHCEPLVSDLDTARTLVDALKLRSERERCRYAELRPITCLGRFASGFVTTGAYVLHTLDLRPGTAQLFRSFHPSCVQRKIRRAEREEFDLESGSGPHIVAKFYDLLIRTRRRFHIPPQPARWFRNLSTLSGDALQIHLASSGRIPIAAILTLRFKQTLTYKYGVSDAQYHATGATAHLLWHAIQDATTRGLDVLDLGRSDLDATGLATFKDHWAARRTPLCYWRHSPRRAWRAGSWRRRAADAAWACVPDRLAVAAGQLLYKHVG